MRFFLSINDAKRPVCPLWGMRAGAAAADTGGAMNAHSQRLFRITCRLQQLLLREFGTTIDVRRTMNDERYARDVLLVCDARPGTDLFSLALHFRRERTARDEHLAQHGLDIPLEDSVWPDSRGGSSGRSGFGHSVLGAGSGLASRFNSTFGSLFGTDADYQVPPALLAAPATQATRAAWYSPARWLGR
ncbi:MAG: hypothetical protein ACK5QH_03010 [Rubrivivax sp.]